MNANLFKNIILTTILLTSQTAFGGVGFQNGEKLPSNDGEVILFQSFEALEATDPSKFMEITQIPLVASREDGSPYIDRKDAGHNKFIGSDGLQSKFIQGYSYFGDIRSAVEDAASNAKPPKNESIKVALYYYHTSDSCEPCKGNKVFLINPITRTPNEDHIIRAINFANNFDCKIFTQPPESIGYTTRMFYEQYFRHIAKHATNLKTDTTMSLIRKTISTFSNGENDKLRSLNPILPNLVETYSSNPNPEIINDLKKWATIHPYPTIRLAAHRMLIQNGLTDVSAEIIRSENNQGVKSKVGELLLQ